MRKYLLKQLMRKAWPAISLIAWLMILGFATCMIAQDLVELWHGIL